MAYDTTVVPMAKSQEGIRKMIYAHKGTGVSFISQPPREGFEAKEERRVWRVLFWHLKAIFEAADSGVIDIRDVILPYVVTPDGHTISERILPRLENLLQNPDRLLPAAEELEA